MVFGSKYLKQQYEYLLGQVWLCNTSHILPGKGCSYYLRHALKDSLRPDCKPYESHDTAWQGDVGELFRLLAAPNGTDDLLWCFGDDKMTSTGPIVRFARGEV